MDKKVRTFNVIGCPKPSDIIQVFSAVGCPKLLKTISVSECNTCNHCTEQYDDHIRCSYVENNKK